MQFNSNADSQDLISDISFLLGGIDTNEYPLTDRTRNINERQRMVWSKIFQSYNGWLFIDDNLSYVGGNSGLPYADLDFASGTAIIDLPSAALTVMGFEMKTTAAGPLEPLQIITTEEFLAMGGDGAFPSTGTPIYALIQGDVIRPLPTPNFTLASAARVYFEEDFAIFLSTDTTKTPGFASPFHRVLSVGAALDYAIAKTLDERIVSLTAQWENYMGNEKTGHIGSIQRFYAKRLKTRFPQRIGKGNTDLVGDNS